MSLQIFLQRPILSNKVNFPLAMAPMLGLTHVAFRELVRSYFYALPYATSLSTIWPTEMLNSRRLPHEKLSSRPETRKAPYEERMLLVPQILGNEEAEIRASIWKLVEWGASGIDINMGCPQTKALKHNYGVALMGDPEYASQIVRWSVRVADEVEQKIGQKFPVSVKLRSGFEKEAGQNPTAPIDFVQRLEQAGASWITLHPRSAEAKRRGRADWTQLRLVREKVKMPVIGNGDIQNIDEIKARLSSGDVDMLAIGRALTARPWLFAQYAACLFGIEKNQKCKDEKLSSLLPWTLEEEGAEYGRALLRMLDLMNHYFPENMELRLRKFRFFVKTGSVWLTYGHSLYAQVTGAQTDTEMRHLIEKFFLQEQVLQKRTDLRE